MSKIQVICIATGDYIGYIPNFLNSIENFFPEDVRKITTLINNVEDFREKVDPIPYRNHIIIGSPFLIDELIYPCINLNKPVYINHYMDTDSDYVFIIDVDTIFKKCPDYDWEWLKVQMDSGKILLTKHPFYQMADGTSWYDVPRDNCISNLYTENLTEKDSTKASYIPDGEYTYINSAFWGGKPDVMRNFNNKIIELAQHDLTRYPYGYHIPKYMDENYVNKIAYEGWFDLYVGEFSELYNMANIGTPSVFMLQKNMEDLKSNRR